MPTRAQSTCPRCYAKYTPGNGCPKCRARTNHQRAQRYNADHRRLRARWQNKIDAGGVSCAGPDCDTPIRPGDRWHLGHRPGGGPRDYLGPLCLRCNLGKTPVDEQ